MSREPLRSRAAYRHWTQITTRWRDNDACGHINNAVHYGWFDTTVNAWLVGAGLLDVVAGDPIGLVVESGCRYVASLAFPQAIEVGLVVARLGSSSVTYHLGIFALGSPAAAAEGHFTHVYVGREDRRPISLPVEWRRKLERLERFSGDLNRGGFPRGGFSDSSCVLAKEAGRDGSSLIA